MARKSPTERKIESRMAHLKDAFVGVGADVGTNWKLEGKKDVELEDAAILRANIPGVDHQTLPILVRKFKDAIKQHYLEHKAASQKTTIEEVKKRLASDDRHNKAIYWERAARRCILAEADPFTWVAAQFACRDELAYTPPNILGTPGALDRYNRYKDGAVTVLAVDMIRHMKEIVFALKGPGPIMLETLQELCLPCYNLPAAALAIVSRGDPLVLEQIGDMAKAQLDNHPNLALEFAKLGFDIAPAMLALGLKPPTLQPPPQSPTCPQP